MRYYLRMKRSKKSSSVWNVLNKKHHLSQKFLMLSGLLLMLFTIGGTSAATYHYYTKSRLLQDQKQNLIFEMAALSSERDSLQAELAEKEKALESTNKKTSKQAKQVQDLKKQVKNLNQKIESLNNQISSYSYSAVGSESQPASQSSIYDRVEVSKKFKPQIIRALDLIKSHDSHSFSVLNTHVDAVYEMSGCGGFQVKRPIYIGNCGFTATDVMIAATIVHETVHVENVYVKKIYSINTKEQELPAYKAQYNFAANLGAPDWYLESIQDQIDYYSSLSK